MNLKMKNVVKENEIKMKSKYRHECQNCSIEIENVVMKMKSKMISKLNQNIGMSVSIAVVNIVQK